MRRISNTSRGPSLNHTLGHRCRRPYRSLQGLLPERAEGVNSNEFFVYPPVNPVEIDGSPAKPYEIGRLVENVNGNNTTQAPFIVRCHPLGNLASHCSSISSWPRRINYGPFSSNLVYITSTCHPVVNTREFRAVNDISSF